jgi:hypothetical protein
MWTAVVLSVFAELFEAAWQRADTLKDALSNSYVYYKKSVFIFLAMHLGYLVTLFVSLKFNLLNWPIIAILAFKTMDIFFKLDMVRRLFGDKELSLEMSSMLESPIPKWYFLAGVFTYPYFIYMAFRV